ncbi:hypothetical protein EVAR_43154_1 [Eumeta japonica]|uniref:Uncharacterized protein n=1 Tax=Eumeta variegata TaxID=151549 RepID=A0A4C1XQ56_EUMVA|nr:hypothetical protein EVAR_43154_1 [Eumeta japonica]
MDVSTTRVSRGSRASSTWSRAAAASREAHAAAAPGAPRPTRTPRPAPPSYDTSRSSVGHGISQSSGGRAGTSPESGRAAAPSPAVRRGDAGPAKGRVGAAGVAPTHRFGRRDLSSARPARPCLPPWPMVTVSHQPPDLHWIIVEGPEYKASIFNKIIIG